MDATSARHTALQRLSALVLTAGLATAGLSHAATAEPTPSDAIPDVPIGQLSSLRRLSATLDPQLRSTQSLARAAAWTELSLVATAVTGSPDVPARLLEAAALPGPPSPAVRLGVTRGLGARDTAAYRLLALGYSPRETADVVSGRISRRALDTARRMIMAGRGHEAAASYLDAQYAHASLDNRPGESSTRPRDAEPATFDGAIARYAERHGVDAALV